MKNIRLKILILLALMAIISLVSGCNIADGDIEEKISAPSIVKAPIEGKWRITEKLDLEKNSIDEKDVNIGSEGLFRNEALIVGTEYATNPSFRLKNIGIEEYLLYKYDKDYKDLGLENRDVEVISILNDNQYFLDMIKLSENQAVVHKDDSFYMVEKISDEVNLKEIERYIEIEKSMNQTVENVENEKLRTGVLMGIKTPKYDDANNLSDWSYKTIWINTKDRKLEGVYELEELLLPRKNGFWELSIERENNKGVVNDSLVGRAVIKSKSSETDMEDINSQKSKLNLLRKDSTLKNLLFIGNDYISVEKIDLNQNERRTLEIYGIDTLEDNRAIKLSDIIGEDGKDIFTEGAESVIDTSEASRLNERNIGLFRNDGYWIFRGRVNYLEKEKELFKDFNIKAIPSEDLVKYDKLAISWSELEKTIPRLQDAYSSPNNEFIIAKTDSKLLLYGIENGKLLDGEAIKIMDLSENTSIIMTEWATGRYTNLWEAEVINSGGQALK